jgi:hypothetical protein
MTTPVLPTDTGQLGPGVLKIGEIGTEIDASCYVNNAAIENSKDKTDDTTKLCGAVRAGVTTYTFQLTGNIDVDAGNESGLFALSWAEKGSQQPFTFTPSTELGTTATGILIVDPLRFGADEYGSDLTSDFTWDIVGTPVLDGWGGGAAAATGATAGTPGTWTPGGSTPPATWGVANTNAVTASPTTAWTTGQFVQGSTAGTPGEMHWTGTAWALGKAT